MDGVEERKLAGYICVPVAVGSLTGVCKGVVASTLRSGLKCSSRARRAVNAK
jgi:hypothetical protein